MSIKDITDYVRLTPGNTNPSVIGSMVKSEMNETLREAKAYTDSQRLGYEETVQKELLAESKLNFEDIGVGAPCAVLDNMPTVTIDDDVTVMWDGMKYECRVKSFQDTLCFGNVGLSGAGDNTGEPFCYVNTPAGDGVDVAFVPVIITMEAGEHTVSITKAENVVHTIDPKFLPSGSAGGSAGFEYYTGEVESDGGYTLCFTDITDLEEMFRKYCKIEIAVVPAGDSRAIIYPNEMVFVLPTWETYSYQSGGTAGGVGGLYSAINQIAGGGTVSAWLGIGEFNGSLKCNFDVNTNSGSSYSFYNPSLIYMRMYLRA